MNTNNVILIIPARGGSKRLPRKNIKSFFGKPIISYPIEAAIKSNIFDEIIVSTDDEEIANIARKSGASVPFLRSMKNSGDFAGTEDVVIEVLSEYSKTGREFRFVCCLYPCSVFITPNMLQKAYDMAKNNPDNSVFAAVKFSHPVQRSFRMSQSGIIICNEEDFNSRTQDLEEHYHDAGQFYFCSVDFIREKGILIKNGSIPIILEGNMVQDIDSETDWSIAEIKYKFFLNASNEL